MTDDLLERGCSPQFVTTRWTLVLRARGEGEVARSALGELCQAYWQPVYRFLLREGRSDDDARELTQGFFAQLLAGSGFESVERGQGRFRSYLLGALKHYLAGERQRQGRLKRGGGIQPDSLDAEEDDSGLPGALGIADPSSPVPDAWFDREWALAVMDGALLSLRNEFIAEDRLREFEALKPWLAGQVQPVTQAQTAAALGTSEGAVKVVIHRLRKRFREFVCKELAQTVPDEAEIDDELRYLIEVLARPASL